MSKTRAGFTLIELLITITLIGILSGIGISTYTASQKRGRDARRLSDLNQYRIGLENYASVNNGVYPGSATGNGTAALATGIFSGTGPLAAFLTGYPKDPKSASGTVNDYYYSANAAGLDYVLTGCMEATSLVWEFCANGKNGQVSASTCVTAIPDSTCDVP